MNGHGNQMNGHQNQMNGHQNQMNGHQNQKQIGEIVTDFDDCSLKSDEWPSKPEANWSNCS